MCFNVLDGVTDRQTDIDGQTDRQMDIQTGRHGCSHPRLL